MTTVSDGLFQFGGSPVAGSDLMPADEYMVCAAASAPASYWGKKWPHGRFKNTIASAYALTTSAQNDTIHLAPGTYTHTALLTWANSNTHLIGMHSPSPWSNNNLINHTGTDALSPLWTISGNDNYFRNLHFRDAIVNAGHHNFLYITGSGNMFENCWFEGPIDGTVADDTDYENVLVDGGGNYFKNCVFGTTASACAGSAQLGWTGSCYRSTFENCIFYHQADADTAVFIDMSGVNDISGSQFFNNCKFISWWSNAGDKITVAIRGGTNAGYVVFDANTIFVGVTAICAASAQFIFSAHPMTAAHAGDSAGLIDSAE